MSKRTQDEILARINKVEKSDWMHITTGDLMVRLTFENVRELIRVDPGETENDLRLKFKTAVDAAQEPLEEIRRYLPFAWSKANECRGLSAGRSLDHMDAWLWLAGVDDTDWLHYYRHYGKKQLAACAMVIGMSSANWDDGKWVNDAGDPSISDEAIAGELGEALRKALEWKAEIAAKPDVE